MSLLSITTRPVTCPRACLTLCLLCVLRAVAVCLLPACVMVACCRHRYRFRTDGHGHISQLRLSDVRLVLIMLVATPCASYTVSCRLAISVGILRHAAITMPSCRVLQAFAACLLSVLSASSSCLLCLPLAFCLLCVLLVCKPSTACLPAVSHYVLASWCLGSGQYAACFSQRAAT